MPSIIKAGLSGLSALARMLLVALIRVYQLVVSPFIGRCCRFYPSCSNYAITAIRTHGCIKGFALATWRVLRCNPFNHGGVDYVPVRRRIVGSGAKIID